MNDVSDVLTGGSAACISLSIFPTLRYVVTVVMCMRCMFSVMFPCVTFVCFDVCYFVIVECILLFLLYGYCMLCKFVECSHLCLICDVLGIYECLVNCCLLV